MATYFGSSTAQKEAARLRRCAVFVVIGCVTSNKVDIYIYIDYIDVFSHDIFFDGFALFEMTIQ